VRRRNRELKRSREGIQSRVRGGLIGRRSGKG
jgi:hypothetical protein